MKILNITVWDPQFSIDLTILVTFVLMTYVTYDMLVTAIVIVVITIHKLLAISFVTKVNHLDKEKAVIVLECTKNFRELTSSSSS